MNKHYKTALILTVITIGTSIAARVFVGKGLEMDLAQIGK